VIGTDISVSSIAGMLGFTSLATGGAEFNVSMLAGAVPFILMLVVLLVRPMGLMGRQ
jgi:branched-subunit amino acid ABC-type transport system permease component